jgi:ABC-type branched-subunit amino acid transport system substrate-binding protein
MLIGLLLPPEEAQARSLRQGAELGVAHANEAGRPPARLVVRGRLGQWGADGEEAARMALDDGVAGLIAPPGGAPSHLTLQIAGRTAIPVVSLCADSSVVGAGIPWMAQLAPGTVAEARAVFAGLARGQPGRRLRWGACVPDGRAGREAERDLQAAADAAGCSLASPVRVVPRLTNLAATAQQILAGKPEAVLLWLEPVPAGQVAQALRAGGFAGTLAGPGRLASGDFATSAGDAAEGVIIPAICRDPASERVFARFVAGYRARFGGAPDATAALAYDAARLLIARLRQPGSSRPPQLFSPAEPLPGASGPLQFDQSGHRLVQLELLVARGGRFEPLASINRQSQNSPQ